MAQKRVLLLVTDGADKVEATTIVNILRCAKLHVVVAGVALKNPAYAECQQGVKIIPDACFEQDWDKNNFDAIIIPSDIEGTHNLSWNASILRLLNQYSQAGKITAFICNCEQKWARLISSKAERHGHVQLSSLHTNPVVVSGTLISSRGIGTTSAFTLAIVEQLLGKEVVNSISKAMLLSRDPKIAL